MLPTAVDCYFCQNVPSGLTAAAFSLSHTDSAVPSLMIAPTRHVTNFRDLKPSEILDIHRVALDFAAQTARPGRGFNLLWNLGPAAGQSLEHIHCHILVRDPDHQGSGLGLRWWLKSRVRGRLLIDLCCFLNRPRARKAR